MKKPKIILGWKILPTHWMGEPIVHDPPLHLEAYIYPSQKRDERPCQNK